MPTKVLTKIGVQGCVRDRDRLLAVVMVCECGRQGGVMVSCAARG